METINLVVSFVIDEGATEEQRERLIRQAAINIENEVEENFKAGAWGGYDGLPVRSCRVSHNGIEI